MNQASTGNLATALIELAGDWGRMIPGSALRVLQRMRTCCFDGVRLISDDQPERLRVEEHTSGPPAVWLHTAEPNVGWIIVDIGERDWSKLAYQFGHELGHLTCNSWRPDAKPAAPCQWLEEALVEAFSLRGLALLADSWSTDPPSAQPPAGVVFIARALRARRCSAAGRRLPVRPWQDRRRDHLLRAACPIMASRALLKAPALHCSGVLRRRGKALARLVGVHSRRKFSRRAGLQEEAARQFREPPTLTLSTACGHVDAPHEKG
jgi:hypothetical protein